MRIEIGRPELSTLRVFDVMLWVWGQGHPVRLTRQQASNECGRGSPYWENPDGIEAERLDQAESTTFPVVSRPSSALCASAASANGNVAPTRKFSHPCSMPLKSMAERFANSSDDRTNHARDGRERKMPPDELSR